MSIVMRNNIIHPQTVEMFLIELCKIWVNENDFALGGVQIFVSSAGNISATNNALIICVPHSSQGADAIEKLGDIKPKINAGPALLQNPNILCAVRLLMEPFL